MTFMIAKTGSIHVYDNLYTAIVEDFDGVQV